MSGNRDCFIEEFKQMLLDNLKTNEELMEEWKTNPYYIDQEVASKFWNEIKKAPMVAIVGDYDVDGICAEYIMGKSIKSVCPDKKIYMRIPRRFSEGYGINETIANEIMEKCPKGTVVVTVDNGITATEVLEKLEASGYPVLMTDHHKKKESDRIPNVTLAVDPVVQGINSAFDYKGWCGAAVAFKLCEQFVPEPLAKELECFAGVATVADAVELREANWGLVRKTIDTFRKGKAPSQLANILAALKQDPVFADEESFGWYLSPCMNAPGRLDDKGGSKVLSYLFAPSEQKLQEIVDYNTQRKALRDEQFAKVMHTIEEEGKEKDCPIWVVVPNLHEGIVGILAGKVAEAYRVPAIVGTFVDENQSVVKASSRTAGDFNLFRHLQYIAEDEIRAGKYGEYSDDMPKDEADAIVKSALKDWYIKFGGHEAAAGFTMEYEKFVAASKKQVERPTLEEKKVTTITSDKIGEISRVSSDFRPYGSGHNAPWFEMEFDYNKENGRMIGKDKNHLMAEPKDKAYKIQHFYHDPNCLSDKEHFGMVGKIGYTSYQGVETPTFKVEDVYDLEAEREIETDKNIDHIR